jgi:M6 family metalloprotease-like protein
MKKYFTKGMSIILAFILVATVASFGASAATTSTITNVIVVARYKSDTTNVFNTLNAYTPRTNWTDIKAYYNDTTEKYPQIDNDISFKNYIKLISRNAVNVNNYFPQDEGTTVTPLALKNDRTYYSDDYLLIKEVMEAINNGTIKLPSDKLDNVQSGIMDCLTVITQGDSDDYPDDAVLYPHKSTLGSPEIVGGKYSINNYIMMDSASVISSQMTGVISHEFMHVMGFPDLYRRAGGGDPVGIWDIMASVGNYKQYPLSYMRSLFGWVPLNSASVSGTYTLDATTLNTDNAVLKLQTPMSDSEFFCIEYRKKKTENVVAGLGIETKIPASGLLIYRVNNAVENHSNIAGNDYIYVFRPNDTSTTASAGEILNAAVTPSAGETSYGLADFSAKVTDNTIFYSNGKNSGIVISGITVSSDGNSITFNITYPDYTSLNLWDKTGSSFGASLTGDIDMDIDANGNIFAAALKGTDTGYNVQVYKWNGTAWSEMGSAFTDAFDQRIKVFDGVPYLVYCNSNGNPVLKKWSGSAWTNITTITGTSYPMSINFFSDSSNLYLTYASDNNKIVINKVTASGITKINDTLTATDSFSNFAAASYNGKLYAEYSYFSFGSSADKNTYISEYDFSTGKWTTVQTMAANGANLHCMTVRDGKLYAITGVTGKAPVYAEYDGSEWTQQTAALTQSTYSGLKIDTAGEIPYVVYSSSSILYLDKKTDSGWENVGEITSDCTYYDACTYKGRMYATAVSDSNSNATVFSKLLYVEPIKISATASKVAIGKTLKLTAAGGTGTYTWTSGDNKTLTVTSDGTVTGVKQGGTTVTAVDNMGNAATYFVKVTPSNGTIQVYVTQGSQYQKVAWWKKYSDAKMKVAYEEYDCENAVSFKWSSSNPFVTVDSNGNVKNNGFFSCSSVLTMTAYDAQGNVVAKGSIKVLFYKLNSQRERFSI